MMRYRCWLSAALLMWSSLLGTGCSHQQANSPELIPTSSAGAKPEEKASTQAGSVGNAKILVLSDDSTRLAQLKYEEITVREFLTPIEATGRITLNEDRSVRVGSLFTGRILEVPVRVGDRMQQGQLLASMHTHEVHEAQAEYAKARAELSQRRTQVEYARSLLDRAERLYQAKALSLNELEKARVELSAARENVAGAEAELERAIGHREHLGLPDTLNYDQPVIVRSPTRGVVIKREITPGASVNPGDDLFFISDLSSIWVVAQVQEQNLASLIVGTQASIKVAAYPSSSFAGRVERIGEMLNPETRTVEVRCVVDNRSGRLKPEMFATVSLAVGGQHSVLTINSAALQEMDGQTVVFVAHGNRRFERRTIKTGRQQDGLVEVIDGASRGERVVTEGSFQLKSEFSKDKLAEKE